MAGQIRGGCGGRLGRSERGDNSPRGSPEERIIMQRIAKALRLLARKLGHGLVMAGRRLILAGIEELEIGRQADDR